MPLQITDNAGVYRIEGFRPGVTLAFSGRQYETLHRDSFLRQAGLDPDQLVLLRQIHSANLVWVRDPQTSFAQCPADGLITQCPEVVLGILTADCVPVFFWDSERRVAAIAHAGWRGVYQGIVTKMVQAFRLNFRTHPESLQIAFGPSIRKCCYEVGQEFEELFPESYAGPEGDKKQGAMDLTGAIRRELEKEGVPLEAVHDTGLCTSCLNQQFFSFRREKETRERILSVICIRDLQPPPL